MRKDDQLIFEAYRKKLTINEVKQITGDEDVKNYGQISKEIFNSKSSTAENVQDYLPFAEYVESILKKAQKSFEQSPSENASFLIGTLKSSKIRLNDLVERITKDVQALTKGDINAQSPEILLLKNANKHAREALANVDKQISLAPQGQEPKNLDTIKKAISDLFYFREYLESRKNTSEK